MKTLEDFKGTREPSSGYLIYRKDGVLSIIPYSTEEAEANAKLFANSYKLLEKASNAHKVIMEGYEYSVKIHALNELQQAIQDCL